MPAARYLHLATHGFFADAEFRSALQHDLKSEQLYVSADSESLRSLSEQNDDRYRIIFGIASWQIGQLRDEIEQGIW